MLVGCAQSFLTHSSLLEAGTLFLIALAATILTGCVIRHDRDHHVKGKRPGKTMHTDCED